MNKLINNRLTAPGRMDVVEKILRNDPFFKRRAVGPSRLGRPNRRGVRKRYSALTFRLVRNMAEVGLDAVTMRRSEVIARAFAFCTPKNKQIVM